MTPWQVTLGARQDMARSMASAIVSANNRVHFRSGVRGPSSPFTSRSRWEPGYRQARAGAELWNQAAGLAVLEVLDTC